MFDEFLCCVNFFVLNAPQNMAKSASDLLALKNNYRIVFRDLTQAQHILSHLSDLLQQDLQTSLLQRFKQDINKCTFKSLTFFASDTLSSREEQYKTSPLLVLQKFLNTAILGAFAPP
jgi:hypothetical protein